MDVPPKIDFLKPEFEELRKEAAKDICIFLGAGFSKQVGFKLWDELTVEVINIFWESKLKRISSFSDNKLTLSIKEQLLSHNDKKYVMDYLCRLDKDKYFESIELIFRNDNRNIKTDILDILKPLINDSKCKFIQTNIDDSFQKYCRIPENIVRINPMFSEDAKLNYLHGRIDKRDSWILTQAQYLSNYLDDNSSLIRFLVGLFKKYTVIFIGYSLSDYEILQAIAKSRINSSNPSSLKEHFALIATYAHKEIELSINEDIYKNNFGINVLKFNIENGGHSLLEDNLIEFVKMIQQIRKEDTAPLSQIQE